MYAKTTPLAHLMPSIQAPPLGKLTENEPAMKKGSPRPTANRNIAPAPSTMSFVVASQSTMPVKNGPVQGAAMRPITRPRMKAPRKPMPPTIREAVGGLRAAWYLEGPEHRGGERQEQHGDAGDHEGVGERAAPEELARDGERHAHRREQEGDPGVPKVAERAAPRPRDFASVAPKMATVIGTMGNTHGVRLAATPAKNEAPRAKAPPLAA